MAVRRSTAAQLSVPLTSPRGVLGAISLESDRVSAFDDQDLTLVMLFAQQATIVLVANEPGLRAFVFTFGP